MRNSTAVLTQGSNTLLPARKEGGYFLDGLRHIDFGRMIVTLPDGAKQEFGAPNEGPTGEIILHDDGVFDELVARGEIGFAEAYMDGRWDSPDLTALITFGLVNSPSLEKFFHGKPLYALWLKLKNALRGNTLRGSRRNVAAHYDMGNDFYALWLDKSMTYSSALFEGDETRSLEDAQQAKYCRILGKLDAKPGEHILEIGCGWGGFAVAAAQAGLRVTCLTLSEPQAQFARGKLSELKLDGLATVLLKDYREMTGVFDHIVSIGMFEHVGEKYWPTYFRTVKSRLKPGGKALVQSITLDDRKFEELDGVEGFIETYIFPGGMLPSKKVFRRIAGEEGLECKEMFGFGRDYARTLQHWLDRFDAHLPEVRALGYDERFIRMWHFYLSSCIASFLSDRSDVMQAELTHRLSRESRVESREYH